MTIRTALVAAVAVAAVFGAGACGGSDAPIATSKSKTTTTKTSTAKSSSSSATTTTSAPAEPAQSACTDLEGTVGPDQVCTVHTQDAKYTIDMKFPVDYPDQGEVGDVLADRRDEFLDVVNDSSGPDNPKALDIKSTTYRSGSPDAGTQSLVFEEYINVGGAHPNTNYRALNYDLTKKSSIDFGDVFSSDADPVAVLDPIVQGELRNKLSGVDVPANPLGEDMYQNFALTDDAVIFFIDQGQWTISAAGAQQISVPRSKIASILA